MLMLNTLTEEQRLSKAVVKIMGHAPYLSAVLMIGKREITDDPKTTTAYTNGKDEFYSRQFVAQLNDAELRFLVLHEVYHKLYKHLTTWRHLWKEDPQRANVACDHVINIKITDEFSEDKFATMTGALATGCYDRQYVGMNSQEVYDLLPPGNGGGGGGTGGDNPDDGQQPFDDHDWEQAEEMTDEEKRELEREIDEAVRQGHTVASKMGSGGNRDLEELLTPKIDWREALRDFITDTCSGKDFSTYNKLNRRYVGMGVAMPSGITEQVGELILAPDMSGSIGGVELATWLTEIKSIAEMVRPEAIRILYWDTQVCADEYYSAHEIDNITKSTKPAGGGGTDVSCVSNYIRDKQINAQAVIVLTDGYVWGDWGQWTMPVLWTILDNERANPDVGKTVHIKSGDM